MNKKSAFLEPWLSNAIASSPSGLKGRLFFNFKKQIEVPVALTLSEWQKTKTAEKSAIISFETEEGPAWLLSPLLSSDKPKALATDKWVESSDFAKIRDAAGQGLIQAVRAKVETLEVHLGTNEELAEPALIGFEMAKYKYRSSKADKLACLQVAEKLSKEMILRAESTGNAVNIARHLVNLPPNELTPAKFCEIAQDLLSHVPDVKIEVWDEKRLAAENCNLMLAVGKASENPPRLLKLSFGDCSPGSHVALVGKGVTFDSGGLDIKPPGGMRLMKKDMAGGAAVLASFYWAAVNRVSPGLEAYVALAENSIGSRAFRPSDVYTSRSGQTVEIHNTDAEGRLVLVDAFDVALESSPSCLINVATLTGAIKVALGSGVGGLFSNHLPLAEKVRETFWDAGDPLWLMPLLQKYRSYMGSTFADMTNATDGFGGAVTAALFLESFVKETPWAHLDVYGWKDGAEGAWSEGGGSGQTVLGLARFLSLK